MALAAITSTGPTVTVTNAQELELAYQELSRFDGGGTIVMEGGDYGVFSTYTYGVEDGKEPVVIKSADANNPAEFTSLYLREAENIRIEGIVVDSTGDGINGGTRDLVIQDSTGIQIVNSQFLHDTDGSEMASGKIVDTMSYIRHSSEVLFEGNYVDGYYHALEVTEVDQVEIVNNELTNMQGDGFRGGGLQNVTIEGNYLHGFIGTDQTINHSDLIQVWGSGAETLTQNLTITGNTLITANAAYQSIFIRNEEFGKAGDSTSGHYENLTITDNLIYNAHIWGVHLDNVNGGLIDGNTLLWNPDAVMVEGGNEVSYVPEIFARNSLNITATNNIAGQVRVPDGSTIADNQVVTYDNPEESTYVGLHFVNPLIGAGATPEDLSVLSSSPLLGVFGSAIGNTMDEISNGATADISAAVSADDQYAVTYDAGGSTYEADATGHTYHWTFADGTTAEGMTVSKVYETGGFKAVDLEIRLNGETVATSTRNFEVQTKDVFAFNFESGVSDVSDGIVEVINEGSTASSSDGTGFVIGDGKKLQIGRETEQLFELDKFGLSMELTPTGDEQTGVFLHFYGTMEGSILDDGSVSFSLTTDQGTYSLISREPVFDDGGTHQIGVAYDGTTGQLELFADGESVSSVEAWGSTSSAQHWNLVFGNTWNDSMDAVIDNVVMSLDPSVAGTLEPVAPSPVTPQPSISDVSPVDDTPAAPPVVADPVPTALTQTPTPAAPSVVADPAPTAPTQTSTPAPTIDDQPADVDLTVDDDQPAAPVPMPSSPTPSTPPVEPTPSVEPDAAPPMANERGTEPFDAAASDADGGNFLSDFFDMLMDLLGLGDDDDETPATSTPMVQESGAVLSELIPVTETPDEATADLQDDDEDDVLDSLAA